MINLELELEKIRIQSENTTKELFKIYQDTKQPLVTPVMFKYYDIYAFLHKNQLVFGVNTVAELEDLALCRTRNYFVAYKNGGK